MVEGDDDDGQRALTAVTESMEGEGVERYDSMASSSGGGGTNSSGEDGGKEGARLDSSSADRPTVFLNDEDGHDVVEGQASGAVTRTENGRTQR